MTKRELNLLGRIWEAEISGRLPFQTKGTKLVEAMERDGLIQQDELTAGGRLPIRVRGWSLTHAGRLAYCLWCSEQPEPTP